MRKSFLEIREELKKWAEQIKLLKGCRKLGKRGNRNIWDIDSEIRDLSYEFRHHHIVYCEVRGRSREEIEKPADNNLPSNIYIEKIKKELLEKIENENMLRSVA